MTNQSRLENDLAEKMRSPSALMQLSEPELIGLLQSITAQQAELLGIPLLDDKLVEAVTSTQGLLNRWHHVVTDIVVVKQAQEIRAQLGD